MAKFDYLPKDQSAEIARIGKESLAPAGKLAEGYLSGIDMSPPKSFEGADPRMYGLENKAMLTAIDRKTGVGFGREMTALKARAGVDAVDDKFKRLNQAAELANAELQHNRSVQAARYAERMNRRRARSAMLGNILGIAGAVGGGMAGGPVGAMAGYGIGQGVGGMAGGGGGI